MSDGQTDCGYLGTVQKHRDEAYWMEGFLLYIR